MAPEYYENRLKGLLESKEEWVRLFRHALPIGGHHTDNLSEASIRVLKDMVLQRQLSYNLVSSADSIAGPLDKHIQNKLMAIAYNRNSRPEHLYEGLAKRLPNEYAELIEQPEPGIYLVPSSKNKDLKYEVIMEFGLCCCKSGTDYLLYLQCNPYSENFYRILTDVCFWIRFCWSIL